MEEKVYDVEMLYIRNTSGTNYVVETSGRRSKSLRLTFSQVEGVEISALRPMEIKNSYIQMAEGQDKTWNMRFGFPTNFSIKYAMGKIIIETI